MIVQPRTLAPALLCALAACASPRYLGSIGRDGVYSNRGYGVAFNTQANKRLRDYRAADPAQLEAVPKAVRPVLLDSELDLNADGVLAITERTPHLEPALRLLSRTTPDTSIDLSVELLGGERRALPAEARLTEALAKVAPPKVVQEALAGMQTRRHPGGFKAWVVTLPFSRWALIDQADFVAEERIPRRQLVWLRLNSPHMDEDRVADHEAALSALILSHRGGRPSSEETW